MSGADTEKLSINLSIVDIGQIDLLVEQGLYTNRTDFIRTATRNLLLNHAPAVQQMMDRGLIGGLGIVRYNKKALERYRSEGRQVDLRIIGLVAIDNDVSPELALSTIRSIKVLGTFRASAAVRKALQDRIE